MQSDFYINHNQFQFYSDKAIDWLINSWKYKWGSDEWKICRLKRNIYMKKALKHLKKCTKFL